MIFTDGIVVMDAFLAQQYGRNGTWYPVSMGSIHAMSLLGAAYSKKYPERDPLYVWVVDMQFPVAVFLNGKRTDRIAA